MPDFTSREGTRASKSAFMVLTLVATGSLFAPQGVAQVINGVVVDSASHVPVPGALVSLVDKDGRDLQRFLVDADGSFRFLVAGPPGAYSVRGERIGLSTTTVGAFDLGPMDTVTIRIVLGQRPIALAGIEASGERRCELRASAGEATHRVWEGARKMLLAVGTAESAGRYVYDLERHVRELEPRSLKIRSERRTRTRSTDGRPIRSRPVELLVADGWVVGDGGGYRYFAPDAHTLLSDSFLATHCLRLRARDDSRPDLVGLEFEPVSIHSGRADIEGVLWLSRETGEVLWLDFGYTGLPGLAAEHRSDQIGGRVEFLGVPDGGWIVSKWHIRMPMMIEEVDGLFGGRRTSLAGIREEGGRVRQALRRGTGRVAYAERSGTVAGKVAGGAPGDRVALVGIGIDAAVDENGSFAMAGVSEGSYRLAYLRPSLLGLDREYVVANATVVAGDTATVRFEVPSRQRVLAAACQVGELNPALGVLLGDVSDAGGRTLEGIKVVAEWVEVRDIGDRMRAEARREETMTNRLGEFRICGIRADGNTIAVTVGTGAERATREVVLSPEGPVGRLSLTLGR